MLSICTTVWNRSRVPSDQGIRELFPNCVRALANAVKRSGLEAELVVADWGSTDWPLAAWLDSASGDLPVQVVNLSGRFSRGAGLNAAAEHARGEVLFFLDCDMLVKPAVLRRALEVVGPAQAYFPICEFEVSPTRSIQATRGYGNCAMTAELMHRVGRWPELPGQDSEDVLYHAAVAQIASVVREHQPVLLHQWHTGGRVTAFADGLLAAGRITAAEREAVAAPGECPTQLLLDRGTIRARDWVRPWDKSAKRFAFVADIPWWAFYREGVGLQQYHDTKHSWTVYCLAPYDIPYGALDTFDLVRFGCVHNFVLLASRKALPSTRRCVVGIASFEEFSAETLSILRAFQSRIAAFVVVDKRLVRFALSFNVPVLYAPDRVDPRHFFPQRFLRPISGPLRVGWAGSVKAWGGLQGVKHVDAIAAACARVGAHFVVHDREQDGLWTTEELCRYYNQLDLYVAANDVHTPTPIPTLEAVACCVAVASTRCGELWPLLDQRLLIAEPSISAIERVLRVATQHGRSWLHRLGTRVALQGSPNSWLYWRDEARRVTEDMAALANME